MNRALAFAALLALSACNPAEESGGAPAQALPVFKTAGGVNMVLVPEGDFEMGSARGREEEKPVHKVHVDAFLMDRTEVTQEQYEKHKLPNPSRFKGPTLPVEMIPWTKAALFCNVRSKAVDSNIKIAIENHAGDMQGRELKMLIEEAGKDFVGACLDSGNPLWTIEDPHLTLETLAPYVLTSHVRDTAVWREKGRIAVQWVRMGEGNIGIREYAKKYRELCPGRAFSLEVIVTSPRMFAIEDPKFWEAYRKTPAWEFARFLTLADKGQPHSAVPPPASKEAGVEREREDLEASIRFAHEELGI
jgi:sugar phosphate isomerase/epimerase